VLHLYRSSLQQRINPTKQCVKFTSNPGQINFKMDHASAKVDIKPTHLHNYKSHVTSKGWFDVKNNREHMTCDHK